MRPIEFGSDTIRMKEVPSGTEAIFRFKEKPEIVETEYGDKFSFPVTVLSHPSHPLLEDGPIDMVWESKSQCARQLYEGLENKNDLSWHKELLKAYNNSKWKLARFDSGVYHIMVWSDK